MLVFELVLMLAGLLFSVLLPPGVVAPPWLLVLGALLIVLLLVLLFWSLVPPCGLQPTRANAAPRMRSVFFISISFYTLFPCPTSSVSS